MRCEDVTTTVTVSDDGTVRDLVLAWARKRGERYVLDVSAGGSGDDFEVATSSGRRVKPSASVEVLLEVRATAPQEI